MTSETTFFSYSRSDAAFVLNLAKDLRAAGADLWLDQLDIEAGSRWDSAIETALNSAQRVIVILSPASVASNNVMDEVSFALESGKTIIPILLSECTIPFRLKRLQYIDFTGHYQTGLNQLIKLLGSAGGSENITYHQPDREPVKKSNSKKYLFIGGLTILLAIIVWWVVNQDTGKPGDQTAWINALQQNDSNSYVSYLQAFPKGAYSQLAKEKLDSFHNKKTTDTIKTGNKEKKPDSLARLDSPAKSKKKLPPAPRQRPAGDKPEDQCATWQSNLTFIKKTYSHNLGTGGKTYTNKATIKQVISSIDLKNDDSLNKLKTDLLNLIDHSPSYPDPNYDMEFTPAARLTRNRIEIEIQKHVDKCK